jgi:predicted kinase
MVKEKQSQHLFSELTLTLIRGLPGSGKTTLAKKLVVTKQNAVAHFEADMFFIDENENYQFDATQLSEAHRWCQKQCELSLKKGQSVIVSNTFIKQWEIKPYRQLSKKYHAKLVIKVCSGNYQSIHNVPDNTIKIMQRQWQV